MHVKGTRSGGCSFYPCTCSRSSCLIQILRLDTIPKIDAQLIVVETASMNEAELAEYARKKGLYVEQIKASQNPPVSCPPDGVSPLKSCPLDGEGIKYWCPIYWVHFNPYPDLRNLKKSLQTFYFTRLMNSSCVF